MGMLIGCTCAHAGDIYVSEATGSARYASQRLDASYRLLPAAGATPAPALAPTNDQARWRILIDTVAARHGIAPELADAVVHVESRHRAGAVSPRGARGLMQLMPQTARGLGVSEAELHVPERNIDAGVRLLKALIERHGGNVALALAAYNAGDGAVARHGARIPPYRETMLFVPAVMARAAAGR